MEIGAKLNRIIVRSFLAFPELLSMREDYKEALGYNANDTVA
jgi:hypothetical protein